MMMSSRDAVLAAFSGVVCCNKTQGWWREEKKMGKKQKEKIVEEKKSSGRRKCVFGGKSGFNFDYLELHITLSCNITNDLSVTKNIHIKKKKKKGTKKFQTIKSTQAHSNFHVSCFFVSFFLLT